jgi:hypothetical protein
MTYGNVFVFIVIEKDTPVRLMHAAYSLDGSPAVAKT